MRNLLSVIRNIITYGGIMSETILTQLGVQGRLKMITSLVDARVPLLLLGPAGSGKSYLGMMVMRGFSHKHLADAPLQRLGELDDPTLQSGNIRALYIAGSSNVTRLDVLGGRTLESGSYTRRPGVLQLMMQQGGIVFLDEVSSLPPQFNILLNEIVDRIINRDCHPNFYMFFAANPGTYLGANELPDSTAERLVTLWFDYYQFEDEVQIVKHMLQRSFPPDSEIFTPPEGFDAFVRFTTGLVQRMRRSISGEEEIPLSVRSISMLATTAIRLGSITPGTGTTSPQGTVEALGVYQKLQGKLPRSMTEGLKSTEVDNLVKYMTARGIDWAILRKSIGSLGIIQRVRGSSFYEAFMSVVPT